MMSVTGCQVSVECTKKQSDAEEDVSLLEAHGFGALVHHPHGQLFPYYYYLHDDSPGRGYEQQQGHWQMLQSSQVEVETLLDVELLQQTWEEHCHWVGMMHPYLAPCLANLYDAHTSRVQDCDLCACKRLMLEIPHPKKRKISLHRLCWCEELWTSKSIWYNAWLQKYNKITRWTIEQQTARFSNPNLADESLFSVMHMQNRRDSFQLKPRVIRATTTQAWNQQMPETIKTDHSKKSLVVLALQIPEKSFVRGENKSHWGKKSIPAPRRRRSAADLGAWIAMNLIW
jgi:hypothetical protein